jgi:predicted SAM-dependent methyltransferase
VADVVADVSGELPFDDFSVDTVIARHILEHIVDGVGTLKRWNRVLRLGGRLVIAVPDENVISGIPLNPEHVHAFTTESLKSLAEACGFKQIETRETGNGISLVSVFEKAVHMAPVREVALV